MHLFWKRSTVYECKLNNGLNGDFDYSHDEPKWQLLDPTRYGIELPMNTLVLAEKCVEYKGLVSVLNAKAVGKKQSCQIWSIPWLQESGQTQRNTLHIIDAYLIDGENLMVNSNYRMVSMEDRRSSLEIFIKAISKPSRNELCPLRLKDLVKVEHIESEILVG